MLIDQINEKLNEMTHRSQSVYFTVNSITKEQNKFSIEDQNSSSLFMMTSVYGTHDLIVHWIQWRPIQYKVSLVVSPKQEWRQSKSGEQQ